MKPGRRMVRTGVTCAALAIGVLLAGCQTVGRHKEEIRDDTSERVTVGTVQREIRVGMTGAEVALVLGSPNIVTTDEKRREVWVYDKIATETAYSKSSGGVAALILGISGSVGAAALPSYNQGSGAASTSQRTLTIVIKFDEAGLVRDFAYHTSRF